MAISIAIEPSIKIKPNNKSATFNQSTLTGTLQETPIVSHPIGINKANRIFNFFFKVIMSLIYALFQRIFPEGSSEKRPSEKEVG